MSHNLLNEVDLVKKLESEVHVWFCFPGAVTDKEKIEEYYSMLSDAEQEKYSRFHFEKDRHSYLVSHALVRKVLSQYGQLQPDEWCFEINSYGKPEVLSNNEIDIKFNLSHTDGLSACVVTLGCDCGVDVESIKRKSKSFAIADRMFAKPEVEIIGSCDVSERQRHFFEYWTLREAFVKAIGTGLGGSSKSFYFTINEHENEQNEQLGKIANIHFEKTPKENDVPGVDQQWQFSLLTPSDDYVAAVAALKKDELNKTVISSVLQL